MQHRILVPTHHDIATAYTGLSSCYMTMYANETAAEHGIKALDLMKAVFPGKAPIIANMALSFAELIPLCADSRLKARLVAEVVDAKRTMKMHYDDVY